MTSILEIDYFFVKTRHVSFSKFSYFSVTYLTSHRSLDVEHIFHTLFLIVESSVLEFLDLFETMFSSIFELFLVIWDILININWVFICNISWSVNQMLDYIFKINFATMVMSNFKLWGKIPKCQALFTSFMWIKIPSNSREIISNIFPFFKFRSMWIMR